MDKLVPLATFTRTEKHITCSDSLGSGAGKVLTTGACNVDWCQHWLRLWLMQVWQIKWSTGLQTSQRTMKVVLAGWCVFASLKLAMIGWCVQANQSPSTSQFMAASLRPMPSIASCNLNFARGNNESTYQIVTKSLPNRYPDATNSRGIPPIPPRYCVPVSSVVNSCGPVVDQWKQAEYLVNSE